MTDLIPFLTLAVVVGALLAFHVRQAQAWQTERRHLVNSLLAETPTDFAIRQQATTPDSTLEAIAEAKIARPKTPTPLGL